MLFKVRNGFLLLVIAIAMLGLKFIFVSTVYLAQMKCSAKMNFPGLNDYAININLLRLSSHR